MSDTSTVDEPDRKVKLEEFYFQRRILFGCTIGLFVATLMWIVAMATNRWFIVSGGPGENELLCPTQILTNANDQGTTPIKLPSFHFTF